MFSKNLIVFRRGS